MADPSGSTPLFPHAAEQHPAPKMPGAVPNGIPPQWGPEGDLKSTSTSQSAYRVTTANGTQNSSHHSHPGSLSSHSSRDSSPAPSRIGVVHPNAWAPVSPQNHSNPSSKNVSASNSNQYQPSHQPPLFNTAVNQSVAAVPTLPTSMSNYQPQGGQNQSMPQTGQVVPRAQHFSSNSVPSSMPSTSLSAGSTPSSTFGPPVPQVLNTNSFSAQSTSQSQTGNPIFTTSNTQQGMPSHGVWSSNTQQQNSFGAPKYSQAPSSEQGLLGQQPQSVPGLKPFDPALSRTSATKPGTTPFSEMEGPSSNLTSPRQMLSGRVVPPGSNTFVSSSSPEQQMHQGGVQEMSTNPGQQTPTSSGHQMPQHLSQHHPASSGSQITQGLGPKLLSTSGQQMPSNVPMPQGLPVQGLPMPSSFSHGAPRGPGPGPQMLGQVLPVQAARIPGQMMPPSHGQAYPPNAGPQGQSMTRMIPPGLGQHGQQMPLSSGPFPPPGLGQQLPSGVVQQVNAGPRAFQRPVPPSQVSHMQGPPLSGQWPPGSNNSVPIPRPSYPSHQPSHPPQAQSYNSAQPPLSQPNQSVSGPVLPRGHPGAQFVPNQHYLAQPPVSQAPGVSGDMALRRYPQQLHPTGPDSLATPMSNLSVTQTGFNKLWGQENYDLLQNRNILPPEKIQPPAVKFTTDFQNSANCSPDIFCCTLTRVPETDSLLKKSRLPLGVLIHPFKDLHNLPVIQCTPIVRCRVCRTYINPFVYFMDEKHWKCNLCFRVNELPDEFNYDPATKTYGEPMRRPEIKSSTIEFIAPLEYMLRPPQPAVYIFLLDVSRLAVESGYLQLVCETLLAELDRLPGDSRKSVGFITYDSSIHFYSLAEGLSAPQQMVVMDIDDVFLPCPENLLANVAETRELIQNFLLLLPTKFSETYDTGSALGAALQAAFKLTSPTGGRVTVFQCCLPNKGPGTLKSREDPANRASKDVPHLNPATDFYKQLALEFAGQQTAVDLFLLNQQYSDLATISGVARFSGGSIYHFPLFQSRNVQMSESFENAFRRYLDRKIGFEAVMRIRCSRGVSIHTFHGNFFVRSTDLLSLPNMNPDAGFGMQVSIDENLSDMQSVCFQAAVLYTSAKGERRIRVHTLCLPIAASLPDILHSADQQCIIGLLAKMAVDRSQQSSLSDARDAFINVVIDALSAYKLTQSSVMGAGLLAPKSLRLLPLYILALLKYTAFRSGTNTRLDDRVHAMCQMKSLPLNQLIQTIYPDLYPVHCLDQYDHIVIDNIQITVPPRLHLSAEKTSSQGAFLLDAGDQILILVGRALPPIFYENVLGVSSFNAIPEDMYELPDIDCEDSRKLRNFLAYLQSEKPYPATLHVIREDSKLRSKFFDRLIEDRTDSSLSYYEFLQHIKNQIK